MTKTETEILPPWWERDRGKCVRGCAEGDPDCGINKKLPPGTTSSCAMMEHWELGVAGWEEQASA